jgi:hypothetical protein
MHIEEQTQTRKRRDTDGVNARGVRTMVFVFDRPIEIEDMFVLLLNRRRGYVDGGSKGGYIRELRDEEGDGGKVQVDADGCMDGS